MDEEVEQVELPGVTPIGVRLREAREAKGLSLEDIASTTRIPKRHLENLERGDFARLPAPTYTMGFVKSYAGQVGIDREEAAAQLREEMDGFPSPHDAPPGYEPTDPKRAMPGWLVWGALFLLVAAIAFFIWYNERQLADGGDVDPPALTTIGEENADTPAIVSANNVVIIAEQPAWIRVTDGNRVLIARELALGESFVIPADAASPQLETSRPEALRITVGTSDAPQIGPDGTRVTGVSLDGEALLRGPAGEQAAATTPVPTPPTLPRRTEPAPRPAPTPARSTPTPTPAATPPAPTQQTAPAPVTQAPAPPTPAPQSPAQGDSEAADAE
ncbi:helix-turn-helix domain-containing protein [Sphingomicrobium flavum]|uniref:helix-turn-helix domain-containing protein n=1 Tax=Sphingomicrobium flavum TaxID=1229164 RepID=UPI0021AD7B2F|nr:helix-turn-helix domain-containing protein [Sphingomicrobium flavum]